MYITSEPELVKTLIERKENRGTINENVDIWIENTYGIPDFQKIRDYYLGKSNGHTLGVLPRHIPSLKIEDVMTFIGARKIGLQPMCFSFNKDRYTVSNWSKNTCTCMPVLTREGKHIKVKYHHVSCKKGSRYVGNRFEKLNNVSLDEIQTSEGIPLLDYHINLRKGVFNGTFPILDVSSFLEKCFSISREQGNVSPNLIAYQNVEGKQIKVTVGSVSEDTVLRPSMEWYYPILFTLFLDGKWVMLETYENAPTAKIEFEQSVKLAQEASGGFTPLVAETPLNVQAGNYTSKALLEYNLQIRDKNTMTELERSTENIDTANIPAMFRQVAEKAISFNL